MELLIVITLILIIAAITIPSLTKAKINANEASAVGSLRAINQAEVSYQAAFGGFADSLARLGGADPCTKSAETACLLDDSLAGGVKSGYSFVAVGGNPATRQRRRTQRMQPAPRRWCLIRRGNDCSARRIRM